MSGNGVGFAFAALCGVREAWHWYQPWSARRRELRETCERLGHQWGEPFVSDVGRHRNCRRCKRQQHWSSTRDEWQ